MSADEYVFVRTLLDGPSMTCFGFIFYLRFNIRGVSRLLPGLLRRLVDSRLYVILTLPSLAGAVVGTILRAILTVSSLSKHHGRYRTES